MFPLPFRRVIVLIHHVSELRVCLGGGRVHSTRTLVFVTLPPSVVIASVYPVPSEAETIHFNAEIVLPVHVNLKHWSGLLGCR